MPTIICPKCQGKLRFPEETAPRRVKCPHCGQIFMSNEAAGPPGAPPPAPPAKSAAPDKRRGPDADFDFHSGDDNGRGSGRRSRDDDDRPRRRDARDDDDDDRRRRRRDDDERRERDRRADDDDRDRRRRRDDDDDDYDRERRRRRDDDYDDGRRSRRDDDDYGRGRERKPNPRAIEGQFNRASLACLLNFIAGWLHVGAFAMMAFLIFLDWCGVTEGLRIFVVIAGLLGLGYWLTSATGLGFLVSGPRERGALGLSIATAATAALHLMLIIVIGTSRTHGGYGAIVATRTAEIHWHAFVTQMPAIPILLFLEIGLGDLVGRLSDNSLLPIFTNLAEIARMILLLLTLKAVMLCARDKQAASVCNKAMMGYAITSGALFIVGVLFGLLLLAIRPEPGKPGGSDRESASAVFHMFFIIMYLVLAGVAVGTTLIVRSVKGKIDYRR